MWLACILMCFIDWDLLLFGLLLIAMTSLGKCRGVATVRRLGKINFNKCVEYDHSNTYISSLLSTQFSYSHITSIII